MYGIVNKAIEDLITESYGHDRWEAVKRKSGVEVDFFISNDPYDDQITYKLAAAAADELGISVSEVLVAFGEWWVLKTGQEKYGSMMAAGGNNLREFLINLPQFHSRIMLFYPKLTPPEFKVSDIQENSLHLHYHSTRLGLHDFVIGLLQGLGKLFQTKAIIEHVEKRGEQQDHDIFKVQW